MIELVINRPPRARAVYKHIKAIKQRLQIEVMYKSWFQIIRFQRRRRRF